MRDNPMTEKLSYEKLKQTVKKSEKEALDRKRADEALRESNRRLQVAYDQSIVYAQDLNEEIAERKRVEKALREWEEIYSTLVEDSLTGIFIHQDGRYLFVNDRFADIHGYQPDELPGKDPLTLIHPDQREALGQVLSKRLNRESAPERYEVRRLRKDGKAIWCEMMATRIEYAGRPAIMGNIIDITERKRVEGALRESEARYLAVLEASPDSIVVYDMEGNCSYTNPAFTMVFGWAPEELIGKKLDYVPEENWPETQLIIDTLMAGHSFPGVESCRYTKDGNILDVSINAAIHLSHDGIPVGSVHFLRDITKRKRAEKALRQRQEELTAKARSLEKVNIALKVLLKQREEDKTELEEKVVSNVKELILPYLQTLRNTRLDVKQIAYVGIIESNLDTIVSPFLKRLSSEYLGFTSKEIQVASLIKDGKTTKEIAELFHVSTAAVDFHRKNIRRKFDLTKKRANLRAYLSGLT
jgi:PAS domain S-box-containing protein